MKKNDEALSITNPRLLSAVYFGLLSIVATIIFDVIFYAVGVEQILPTFQAILLAVVLASCFGALFGERIIYSQQPYRRKAFLWGFMMVLAALPIYALIFFYLFKEHHPHAFAELSFSNLFVTYLFILLYSFLVAGFWLAIAAGLAAMYLRGHLVYDILHSKSEKLKPMTKLHTEKPHEEIKPKPEEQDRKHIVH
ncbi:hypothetical protein [Legionella micdadei]|uniref:Uncharacterized protein n=1 Tax=Legionella micdadei TaxID=451 RepID=A0A098GCV6_LEGMI|nr:hypothetical protein [Legionella micdadei]ARG98050.1 hypothetical protein B6N58_10465 [Legionella micdadei]ARH00846.1 hypothetical protein B6V88_10685 [Legionella micdadei]KTD30124.1 hypothetical protein Lmic_0305 [Legionella micdadei]NSL18501.1 hypothetical protein [Legionella micdadei]CEG60319.1 conserved membrane protein of unknown function [Legionella micdadei]